MTPSTGQAGRFPALSLTPEIEALIRQGAPVALGISGGKDSDAMAIAVTDYLDSVGHPRAKRVMVHADLGLIEWPETPEWVERLATHLGAELLVVRRNAGDMIQRWEKRWENNVARYANLDCVTLITPWSTPSMRFCTSELKIDPITSALKKRFPDETIISASGIRAEESPNRAKAPIAKEQGRLKRRGLTGYDWHPILAWTLQDVLNAHRSSEFPLHPAYTQFGSSRLSCSFCMLARLDDHLAALKQSGNHPAYRRLVELEVKSTFSFQHKRWLADRMPELMGADFAARLQAAKAKGLARQELEQQIPKEILYVKGWPERMPTVREAATLASVRQQVCALVGIESPIITPNAVLERYAQLMDERSAEPKAA